MAPLGGNVGSRAVGGGRPRAPNANVGSVGGRRPRAPRTGSSAHERADLGAAKLVDGGERGGGARDNALRRCEDAHADVEEPAGRGQRRQGQPVHSPEFEPGGG